MYSKVRLKENSVVIYYSANNSTMRYKTGVTVSHPREWNKKKQELASTAEGYKEKMKIVNLWRQRSDDIINKALEEGYKISGTELKKALDKFKSGVMLPKTSKLIELYSEFHKEKEGELVNNPRKSAASLKDYTSLLRTLIDYERETGTIIYIADVDRRWCDQFNHWLGRKRPEESGYLTKGGLGSKTVKKRFDTLKSFYRWLQEKEVIQHISPLVNYTIRVSPTIINTLSIDEVRLFYITDLGSERLNRVKDLFVFACHTGLRWEDLKRIRRVHLKEYEDGTILSKITHKSRNTTQESFSVPLSSTAVEIFERYDFNLDLISHPKANEYIKEAFKISGDFDDFMDKKDKEGNYLRRWQYFSFHDARRTFITNLVNSAIPVNEIMKYTGHKKISTLQQYIDRSRPTSFEHIKILD